MQNRPSIASPRAVSASPAFASAAVPRDPKKPKTRKIDCEGNNEVTDRYDPPRTGREDPTPRPD